MTAIAVIAKAPVAGRCKTRMCPPCTPQEAATLAGAALLDTLTAVAAAPATRRVVLLDGEPGEWLPPGFELVPQRGDGLAERLEAGFVDLAEPALVIGMDTPQVTPALLAHALARLQHADAVVGPAPDGGYWAIGLRRGGEAAFRGVPMSDARTEAAQRARLRELGLRVAVLPALRDVDDIEDARAVAALAPGTRFSAALRALRPTVEARAA